MHGKYNAKPTQTETKFVRNYRKAYMTLLSAATETARGMDEYFFGQADDRDEASEEIRPYFYGFLTFCSAVGLWVITQS